MTDSEFDAALIAAAMRIAGEQGWARVSPVAAAREADLPLGRVRHRFPTRWAILARFGQLADAAVLEDVPTHGTVRDRLFDLLMRRFDALQAHRPGVLALLHALPYDPVTACLLTCATRNSMRWMLQAAGAPATGVRGELQVRGLMGVWLWALRAWERDVTEDLSGTMRALDEALIRAEQVAGWLSGRRAGTVPVEPATDDVTEASGAGELDPAHPPAEPSAPPSTTPGPDDPEPSGAQSPAPSAKPPSPSAGEIDPSTPPPGSV